MEEGVMRMIADCRAFPSESRCSLTITGEADEVVRAAAEHAVSVHGHADSPELREQIRASLTTEAGRFGTVMVGRRRAGLDELRAAALEWDQERQVSGFLRQEVLDGDDGATVVAIVTFASRADYERLGQDPAQHEWWTTTMAPMLDGEPTWIDGTWTEPLERGPARADLPEQGGASVHEAGRRAPA
jgi:hypothetical protein